ncbi:MFS transporter [Streptomyces sp. NPDC001933]|uniref:MFS transporter n=1 Tax=Streptomyces sp. NPDC001933 TaxID=3364626 RepID=UPI0036B2BE0B
MTPDTTTGQRAGARAWAALAVLGVPAVLVMMNMSVLNLALPSIGASLEPGSAQLLWIADSYGFAVAGLLVTMGALGDRFGHRRILLGGAAAFTCASLLAAFSHGPGMLIAARVAQGIAAAALAPSSLAVIRRLFTDPRQRTLAITIWMLAFLTGGAIGPLLGGLVLQHFWWGAVFLLSVPAMLVLVITGPALLPRDHGSGAGRIDALSVAAGLACPVLLVAGVKILAADGGSPQAWGCAAVGAAAGVLFWKRQRILADPLIDTALFRSPGFTVTVTGMLLVGMVLFGTSLLSAQYLQLVLGHDPLTAGLWTLPSAVVGTAAALLATGLAARWRPLTVMALGTTTALAGPLLLGRADHEPWFVVGGSVLLFAGLTPYLALGTGIVLDAAPAEQAGAASAISETGGELGGALGIALLGSISAAAYRADLTDRLPPGLAPDAASRTLAGTLDRAAKLPPADNATLTEAATTAFTHSIHVHAGAVATIVALLACATWLMRARLKRAGLARRPATTHS